MVDNNTRVDGAMRSGNQTDRSDLRPTIAGMHCLELSTSEADRVTILRNRLRERVPVDIQPSGSSNEPQMDASEASHAHCGKVERERRTKGFRLRAAAQVRPPCQDYELQMMLLQQQNMKMLQMARMEQDLISSDERATEPQAASTLVAMTAPVAEMNRSDAFEDYRRTLKTTAKAESERKRKKAMLVAWNELDTAPSVVERRDDSQQAGIGPSLGPRIYPATRYLGAVRGVDNSFAAKHREFMQVFERRKHEIAKRERNWTADGVDNRPTVPEHTYNSTEAVDMEVQRTKETPAQHQPSHREGTSQQRPATVQAPSKAGPAQVDPAETRPGNVNAAKEQPPQDDLDLEQWQLISSHPHLDDLAGNAGDFDGLTTDEMARVHEARMEVWAENVLELKRIAKKLEGMAPSDKEANLRIKDAEGVLSAMGRIAGMMEPPR